MVENLNNQKILNENLNLKITLFKNIKIFSHFHTPPKFDKRQPLN